MKPLCTENLYFLGDQCAPGILINDILHDKMKKLFMLGIFPFNSIVDYISDRVWSSIYDIQYLTSSDNVPLSVLENSEKKYSHTDSVKHTKYGFVFNHDFLIRDNAITNYAFIVDSYTSKIATFTKALESEDPMCFITFTDNVDALRIEDMITALNKESAYFIIFTNSPFTVKEISNVFVIQLKTKYWNWWGLSDTCKNLLESEIYTSFLSVLSTNNISHTFTHHPPQLSPTQP
jgi:hypothetical protein